MAKNNAVILHGISLNMKTSISRQVTNLTKITQSTTYLYEKFMEYKNQGLNPLDFVLIKLGIYNGLDARGSYLIEKGIIENIYFNTLMNDETGKASWKGLDLVFTEDQVKSLIEEENRLLSNFTTTRVLITTHNRDFLYSKLVQEDNALRNQIFDCDIDCYLQYQTDYVNMLEKYHKIDYHFKLEDLDENNRFDLTAISNLLSLF